MRVIFSECSVPFLVDMAGMLADEHGWEPRYWVAHPAMRPAVKARFPGAVFHSSLDAARGIPSGEFPEDRLAPVDETLLAVLSADEPIVLKMMDRMDLGDFGYDERVHLYHRLLMYWQTVLDHVDPGLVFFPVSPHLVYDFVLYMLCRQRGIRTLMFENVALEG